MADYEQTTKTNPRRPDCVTKIRMGNSGPWCPAISSRTAPKLPLDKMGKKCAASRSRCYTEADLSGMSRGHGKKRPCFDMAAFALG